MRHWHFKGFYSPAIREEHQPISPDKETPDPIGATVPKPLAHNDLNIKIIMAESDI